MYYKRFLIALVSILAISIRLGGVAHNHCDMTKVAEDLFDETSIANNTVSFNLNYNGKPYYYNAYFYNKPQSKIIKFISHIKSGSIRYALRRLWLELTEITYKLRLSQGFNISLCLLLLIGIPIILFLLKAKKQAYLLILFPVTLVVFMVLQIRKPKHPSLYFRYEKLSFNFYPEKPIGACAIFDDIDRVVGQVLWAKDSDILVDYDCCRKDMSASIENYLKEHPVLAITSATYFDRNNIPVGLMTRNGSVENPFVNTEWDGLAIIKNNKLKVGNLKTMELIGIGSETSKVELASQSEKSICSIDIADTDITAFQLPLLIFNNKLLIDYHKTPYRLRELRLLCSAIPKGNDNKFYLIINFEEQWFLPNVVYSLFEVFNEKEIYIEYALLLDVGNNNFLNVFNYQNQSNPKFKSYIPSDLVNNFIVFLLNSEHSLYDFDL